MVEKKLEMVELEQKCINQVQVKVLKCGPIDEVCPRITISTTQQIIQGTQYLDVNVTVSGTNPQECCRKYSILCGIYNSAGQQVVSPQKKGPFSVNPGQSYTQTVSFRFDVSNLPPGMYIVRSWIVDEGVC